MTRNLYIYLCKTSRRPRLAFGLGSLLHVIPRLSLSPPSFSVVLYKCVSVGELGQEAWFPGSRLSAAICILILPVRGFTLKTIGCFDTRSSRRCVLPLTVMPVMMYLFDMRMAFAFAHKRNVRSSIILGSWGQSRLGALYCPLERCLQCLRFKALRLQANHNPHLSWRHVKKTPFCEK